jgi:nucleoside-diphosphate-sugar epimerase
MGKKVLVTGANGFFGSNLCRKLAEQGHQVRGLVRPTSDLSTLNGTPVELVQGDLASGSLPDGLFDGVEVVYHIAGLFRQESLPLETFFAVNAQGVQLVLEGAMRAGVERAVHCSTIGVLGHIKNPPGNEETPYSPGDHYQDSKTEGEKIALEFHREHGYPVAIVRPGSIYGPGDMRFVKLFKSIKKGMYFIVGSGETHLHFVYIDDLVDGTILAAETPAAAGETFILADSAPITHNELAACIGSIVGRSSPTRHLPYKPLKVAAHVIQKVCVPLGIEPPLYPRRLDFFTKNREFDISKARRILGYTPKVDLQTGLKRTAAWYRENNLL